MNGEGRSYTGEILVKSYGAAARAMQAGEPDADLAVDGFGADLDRISMRDDDWGLAARRARADMGRYFEAAVENPGVDPDDFVTPEAKKILSSFLVDDGELENTRRYDLLGDQRKPLFQGDDGKFYVSAAGANQEIPIEWARKHKDALVRAAKGEMNDLPVLGAFYGPEGASVLSKSADYATRAIITATTNRSWEEVPPLTDVPTADPARPLAVLPAISDNPYDAWSYLQDPVKLRAIQEVLGEAADAGELDPTVWGTFVRTAGFLTDFAVTNAATGAVGKLAGGALKSATASRGGALVADTLAAAETRTALQGARALSKPAIPHSFATIKQFAGYHVVNDALHGEVKSVGDVASSGLAGAKEGALMLGAGMVARLARTGLMRSLGASSLDSATKSIKYRLGSFGETVAKLGEASQDRATIDQLVARTVKLASDGKGLRETLVRAGWPAARAQMIEHSVDSAAIGLAFGAYQNAIADPEWDNLGPWEKTARMVAGLTSPEAIGGAGAFAGSVLAHAYAHKAQLGREWKNAPEGLRVEFDQRVANIVDGLANPNSHELVDSFRRAFDTFREKSPKDFEGIRFREPWETELAKETATALAAETAEYAAVSNAGVGLELPQGQPGMAPEGIGSPRYEIPNKTTAEATPVGKPKPRSTLAPTYLDPRAEPVDTIKPRPDNRAPIGPQGIGTREQLVETLRASGRPVDEQMAALVVFDQNGPNRAADPLRTVHSGLQVIGSFAHDSVKGVVTSLAETWRRELSPADAAKIDKWTKDNPALFAEEVQWIIANGKTRKQGLGKAVPPTMNGMLPWVRGVFEKAHSAGLDVRLPAETREALAVSLGLKQSPEQLEATAMERMKLLTPEAKGEMYRRNRNKAQYVGMPLEEIVMHELRGGLPTVERTTPIKLAQAGDSLREAAEVLRLHGALRPDVPIEHGEVQKAVIELIRGGGIYRESFNAQGAQDALSLAVEAARRAQTQMREVGRELVSERFRDKVDLVYEYLDVAQGTEMPADVRARLEAAKLYDGKTGRFDNFLVAALGMQMETAAAIQRGKGALIEDGRLIEPTYGARPWLAWGRVNNAFQEHALAQAVKLKRAVDWYQKSGLPPSLLKQIQKVGALFGGMWQNNAVASVHAATNKMAAVHVFQEWESAVQLMQARGEDALARIAGRFGWRVAPRSHMKLLNWAIESGQLQRMKGPEGFEAIRPGTGYLFEIARDINDVLMQLGQHAVEAQFLAPGQFEKLGGKWIPHTYLKLEAESDIKELREGRVPVSWALRNLSRRGTPEEATSLQIEDPFSWLPTALHQESRVVQYLGTVQDLLYGGYAIKAEDWNKLDPYSQGQYERFALPPDAGASLANGPARRNWDVLSDYLAKQLDPADPRPKSRLLQKNLAELLGVDANGKRTPQGSRYVSRQLLWEIDALTGQTFNPPDIEGLHNRALYAYEQATRSFRRGLTIGRPKHWTLNILNSIGTNHALDRLPMWDVARSVITGTGYFADGIRDVQNLLELSQRGNPKEKPQDWSVEKWDRVQMLQDAFRTLNGTTFTGVGFEASVVTDALSAVVSPDMQTAGLLRDLEAKGYSPETGSAWKYAILDASRRMTGGMAEFDRRIAQMMGSHDPSERARAVQNFSAFYQLWEMAMKWPAVLRTIDTQPVGISLEQAVRYAAVGTADYSNTSPVMRSFNTANGSLFNPLYRRTEGVPAQVGRAIMREALKGRFWMYSSTMAPALASSVLTHPIRAATVMAVASGLSAVLHNISTKDPEDEAAWQEAFRGSVGNAGSPVIDESVLKHLGNTGFPNVSGGAMPVEARGFAADLYRKMLQGTSLVFQAPSRGDETRVSSLEDLSPGYGNWLGMMRGAQNFAGQSNDKRIESVFDTMSLRSMELSLAIARLGYDGLKTIGKQGPEEYAAALKDVRQAASDVIPTISPFFLASRDGQRFLEVSALNGQNFDEWARGIIPANEPKPIENLGEFLFSSMWRSQRLMQPKLGGVSEREAMDGVLGRLFPESSPSQGEFWDKNREAQSAVHYQLSEILSGTYDEWLRWGRGSMTFDAMLVPALLGDNGQMQRFIAQETDPEKQDRMREYFRRFVTGDEWERVAGSMMNAARTRSMRPDYFRQAATNAMRDPTGQALLNWIDSRVVRERPRKDELEDLATAFFLGVAAPAPGDSLRYKQWSQVYKKFVDYGLSTKFIPDNAAEALRRLNLKPELSGLPAYRESLLTR